MASVAQDTPTFKVLCVEDDYLIRELLEIGLPMKCNSLAVTTVKHGLEAIEYLSTNEVDLIVTDFDMPLCNGAQLAKHVEDSGTSTPVVVFSGQDHSKLRQDVPSAEAYVSKTAAASSLSDLASAVISTLQNRLG